MGIGIKDTAAWHVIEQLLKHVWGPSEEMDDDEILTVCKLFWKADGSWKNVMDGDPKHIGILEECIGNAINARKMKKIAMKIIGNV